MVRKLDAAPVSMTEGLSAGRLRLRDGAMHRLGVGTTRDMISVFTGVFIPVWQCRAYKVGEKVNFFCRSIAFSRDMLWADFIQTDLINRIHTLDLPIYFFTGVNDHTATHDLARNLFDQIKAPVKGFYTFASKNSP